MALKETVAENLYRPPGLSEVLDVVKEYEGNMFRVFSTHSYLFVYTGVISWLIKVVFGWPNRRESSLDAKENGIATIGLSMLLLAISVGVLCVLFYMSGNVLVTGGLSLENLTKVLAWILVLLGSLASMVGLFVFPFLLTYGLLSYSMNADARK